MFEINAYVSEILKDKEIVELLSRDEYIAAKKLMKERFPEAFK